jgi:hypothetical protein
MFVWWEGFQHPFFWHIPTYIPWIHKCVKKTVEYGTSHNTQFFQCKILQAIYTNSNIHHLHIQNSSPIV